MTVPTATVVVPAPERERRPRQGRETPEIPGRAPLAHEPVPAPPGTAPPGNAPQVVVLAGEDEDACRREPHIWRGID
ncbi:hypothetical protein PV396_04590 [Streptomyces sp. ME02-8801-2C]|uniref:hypothetical protein n=1 Tax=Streptomyces sp. ME02-8801-2C TaxID=3028680 RepID=UPI0029B07C96|nr:hypothetical protein [Streptomyces sp. ME02-8801-2C]MDX3451231.1 hypothetical protein [Streptomyces sp. ME02-8801-2C]